MTGVVEMVSAANGFVAVRTENDEYSIVELLGADVEVGDTVSGKLEHLGGEILVLQRTGERISVFIQDIHATAKGARRLLQGS